MGNTRDAVAVAFRLPGNLSVTVHKLTVDAQGYRIVPLAIRLRLLLRRAVFASKLIVMIVASVFSAPPRPGRTGA